MIDQFPDLSEATRVERLSLPEGGESVPAVLDTDAYNEIDDQFALIHALGTPEIDLRAVHATPFDNPRSSGPTDGMERSYAEIERLLDRAPAAPDVPAREGAERFMEAPRDEVESPATENLIRRAEALDDGEGPLYVVAIGAATNVASALLVEPDLVEDIVVVWLGGPPADWGRAREFNLAQDPHAARVLLDSGVPLVRVPTSTVSQLVRSTVPELRSLLSGRGQLAEFLLERFAGYAPDEEVWSKEIWDLAGTACLACPWTVTADLVASPALAGGGDQPLRWSREPGRHLGRELRFVERDGVFESFLDALDAVSGPGDDR